MSDKSNKNTPEYGAGSIRILEGLEAVRKRPAMYIGSVGPQGLHHLVWEVVDNSVDEALAGHCDTINIVLYPDGTCSVEDNGRGIPVDLHPTEGVSAVEIVFTKLHAGGKFDKDTYKFSGGLHGVGASVVNALSEWLTVEVYKNGNIYAQSFKRGTPVSPLVQTGTTTKRGTYVRFKPDSEIFKETTDFNFDTLSTRLRELAFLNKGLRIAILDERSNKSHEFFYEGGIISFVESVNAKKTPIFPQVVYFEKADNSHQMEIAFQYNDGFGEQTFSFVNNINTIEGGTHVTGFRAALTKVCNKKATEMKFLKDNDSFSSEDVREGLVCVINMKVAEPQFEGQTKAKLGNSEVKGLVESWTSSFLDSFFEENPAIARKILQKAELALHAREAAKKARELTRRKTVLESTVLPGKLADCAAETPAECELFIVEGDSAGGSAKQARDRHTQAILPIRGKILNVEKARLDKILGNEEIRALISAVGTGIAGEDFAIDKARYHKIVLMTDADVDGSHIRTLLLTFFFRYMKPVVEAGYLYIAQPPLYKIKLGKSEEYLKDDTALKKFLANWARENTHISIEGKTLSIAEWHTILDNLAQYEILLDGVSRKYKLTMEQTHLLASAIHSVLWEKAETTDKLISALQPFFKEYAINLIKEEIATEEGSALAAHHTYIRFARINREWQVSLDFFLSEEVHAIAQHLAKLDMLNNGWTIKMIDKERSLSGTNALELLEAVETISKPYINIQRYKGLGEMNPEQLWETSMDPNKRLFIQVSVGDALEADSWFDTLMGDDVSGRREFIEENGHFVKNLDI
jgi:DNA gyrase subunit B